MFVVGYILSVIFKYSKPALMLAETTYIIRGAALVSLALRAPQPAIDRWFLFVFFGPFVIIWTSLTLALLIFIQINNFFPALRGTQYNSANMLNWFFIRHTAGYKNIYSLFIAFPKQYTHNSFFNLHIPNTRSEFNVFPCYFLIQYNCYDIVCPKEL